MPLHLVKLCVGARSVADLAAGIERRLASQRDRGLACEHVHTTRMYPRRDTELRDGGSLYWVIQGAIQVRQRFLAIRAVRDDAGIGRCQLVLEAKLVATELHPRRPFQGWRYLSAADAPRDLDALGEASGLPAHIAQELAELGLL